MKASKILFLVFVIMISLWVVNTQPAISQSSGTIYIRADGSVEGTDKILREGDVYTFTDNIFNQSIVVERDNIIVDGASYTVQGIGSWHGIDLSYRNNVTLQNVEVTNFYVGIYVYSSSNNTLVGNNASNNEGGIHLFHSSNNIVSGNTVQNNTFGIYFEDSGDNMVFHNNLINNTNQVFNVDSTNTWDDGAKGNYWSDYEERYPNATELDDSGIWNTPYEIDENNQDNYPIVPEFPAWTSMLLILIVHTVAVVIYKRRLLKTPSR